MFIETGKQAYRQSVPRIQNDSHVVKRQMDLLEKLLGRSSGITQEICFIPIYKNREFARRESDAAISCYF